ncbi:MAG TPA: non-ribosomal peptide synthetase, partial [Pyrinomonadaceae bacterium]
YLVQTIKAEQITTLHFVPSMLQVFVEEAGVEQCETLRRVICSGEALPWDLQERFFARLTDCELHNLYGPTEAAVDVTWWRCERESSREIVPIGHPIGNIEMHILDRQMNVVPVGVAGEIYIGGVGLARGYVNQAGLTAERFVPHPLSGEPGERLYRTGDIGRRAVNGEIEYLGRIDEQVKIRGFRIELGEIEARLTEQQLVREAVVLAREDQRGDKRLVAYVVATDGETLAADELRKALSGTLPEYMIPAVFMMMDALPLTPNGKINRRALPMPEQTRSALEHTYVAPQTPTEETLVRIWEEVMRLERIGTQDNFFQLGGHSLMATQVISRVRAAFSIELPLRRLFERPTVAALAEAVLEGLNEQEIGSSDSAIIKADPVDENYLLANLDELSSEELDLLLGQMLAEKELEG